MKSSSPRVRRNTRRQKETWYGTTGMVWSLDPNDLRRVQDVGPETGLTLRQAMLHYDQENRAEQFCELEALGYGGDPPMLIGPDGWPTDSGVLSDFRFNARRLGEDRARLEYCLIEKLITGRLTASGYASTSRLDEPAQDIAPDRWRTLTPDFEWSRATAPGVTISGILVFEKRPAARAPTPHPRTSPAKLRAWYVEWVAKNTDTGTQPVAKGTSRQRARRLEARYRASFSATSGASSRPRPGGGSAAARATAEGIAQLCAAMRKASFVAAAARQPIV